MFALACWARGQTFTVVYAFQGQPDGTNPFAAVTLDAAGNLYGTAETGGAGCPNGGCGAVFKISKSGTEKLLYSFTGGSDGSFPAGTLVRDAAGNFYSTTQQGGGSGRGTVFKLNATGKETVLYSFTGGADGGTPTAGLVLDTQGNLYGTTRAGGAADSGTVFKLDTSGKETVLYSFTGGADGAIPAAALIRDAAGNFYGTTATGGDTTCNAPYGCGTVFKIDANGTETVLHAFTGTGGDGSMPYSSLVRDSARNLYGTTANGGNLSCIPGGCGTVFRVSNTGTEAVIYQFKTANEGAFPAAGLLRDAAGTLYGTTWGGGTFGYGTVFKVDKTGKETVLHSFNFATDGAQPLAPLVRDHAGNLYGTTSIDGGTACGGYGCGTVFKIAW